MQIGDKVLVKLVIAEIRMTKEGVKYIVTPERSEMVYLNSMTITDEDIITEG